MEAPVYEETQSMQFRWVVLMLTVAAMVASTIAAHGDVVDYVWISVLAVGIFLLLWKLLIFRVIVTKTEIRFGYPFWRKRIPLTEVRVGTVDAIPLWAGVGIHLWRDRWVYNGRLGRGVTLRSGGRTYLVGSDLPESLQSALLTSGGRREQI
jgi:hypothetical protein